MILDTMLGMTLKARPLILPWTEHLPVYKKLGNNLQAVLEYTSPRRGLLRKKDQLEFNPEVVGLAIVKIES